jgi:hypothetical protein
MATTGTATFDQVAIVTGPCFADVGRTRRPAVARTDRPRHAGRPARGRHRAVGRSTPMGRDHAVPARDLLACLRLRRVVGHRRTHHRGRDTGPFGTPAHYPIFFGILGVIVSGVLPIALARKPLPARTIKLTRGWRIPCSAALVTVCGTFALVGFPMDDLWHRLFGEDVTLWGPTHLLMIGGVVFSIFGRLLALAEVEQLVGAGKRRLFQEVVSVGALLIAWDLFSTEFNYGVPQFPLILQPILIAFGASIAFTAMRARRGPGTTFGALAVYLVIRGGTAWAVETDRRTRDCVVLCAAVG